MTGKSHFFVFFLKKEKSVFFLLLSSTFLRPVFAPDVSDKKGFALSLVLNLKVRVFGPFWPIDMSSTWERGWKYDPSGQWRNVPSGLGSSFVRAGHVFAEIRGKKPFPSRWSRETACFNLFVFIASVNKNGEGSKRRDCVRCWLHLIVSYRISFVVLNWRFTPLGFLRLQNSFGKMSIQPHGWLKHAVLLYSS